MKNEIRVMLEDQYVVIVQAERKYRIDRNQNGASKRMA